VRYFRALSKKVQRHKVEAAVLDVDQKLMLHENNKEGRTLAHSHFSGALAAQIAQDSAH